MSNNILAIDWDYFFPVIEPDSNYPDNHDWTLYDWNHKESMFHINTIWPIRAAAFMRRELDLPGTSGEEKNFWENFNIKADAKLYVAESNSMAASTDFTDAVLSKGPIDELWLYDAHHDSGYRGPGVDVYEILDDGTYSCEDWMILYWGLGADLRVRYPKWKPNALLNEPEPPIDVEREVAHFDDRLYQPEFDTVFLCRSGAWTPPWTDRALLSFIDDCPTSEVVDLDAGQPHGLSALTPRGLDLDSVHEMAKMEQKVEMMQETAND